jgi:hypothetical protein
MNSAQIQENEDKERLRKSTEFVEYCREAEAIALQELARARAQLARAREKHFELFQACEKRACDRRKSGQIEYVAGY